MGKKRKYELDLDMERTMYSSFVSAANSVSQLYTHAVQHQRKAATAASHQTLERVIRFVLHEFPGSDVIHKASLLQFLQQEHQALESQENTPQQLPAGILPFAAQATQSSGQDSEQDLAQKAARMTPSQSVSMLSPSRRAYPPVADQPDSGHVAMMDVLQPGAAYPHTGMDQHAGHQSQPNMFGQHGKGNSGGHSGYGY